MPKGYIVSIHHKIIDEEKLKIFGLTLYLQWKLMVGKI